MAIKSFCKVIIDKNRNNKQMISASVENRAVFDQDETVS